MALINNVEEVKLLIPNFISNLSDDRSLPNFDLFDTELLIPVCGLLLYDDISTKKDSAILTTDETIILKKMQMVSVCYAYAQSMALGHITITDTGTKKFASKDTQPIAKWEFEKAQKALYNMALNAVDALVEYLFFKMPEAWLSSEYYVSSQNLLIKSGNDFNNAYKLHNPQATYFFIRNRIADAQTMYLKDIMGYDFLKYFIAGIDVPPAISDQIILLKKALAYFTIHQCCLHDNVAFGAEGFTVIGSTDDVFGQRVQAAGLDVDMKARESARAGNDFLNRARYELTQYYHKVDADATFKEMLDASPMKDYVVPELRKTGNEKRRGLFRF